MRTFTYPIKDINLGLSPEQKEHINGNYLMDSHAISLNDFGIAYFTYMAIATSMNQDVRDLYAVNSIKRAILIQNSDISYYIDKSTAAAVQFLDGNRHWNHITDVINDPPQSNMEDRYHIIDFGDAFYLLSTSDVLAYNKRWAYDDNDEEFLTVFNYDQDADFDTFRISTGCNFKGKVVFGGFDSSKDWGEYWTEWLKTQPYEEWLDQEVNYEMPGNMVMWSPVGIDIIPSFYSEDMFYGDQVNTLPDTIDLFKRGDMGFMPMLFGGDVLCIKPLRDQYVVVYGEDGITLLTSHRDRTTFGRVDLKHEGLYHRDCVVEGATGHLFLSANKELWFLNNEGQTERLGYSEWMGDFVNGATSYYWSYDYRLDTYYITSIDDENIASSKQCFSYKPGKGLLKNDQFPIKSISRGVNQTIACTLALPTDLKPLFEIGPYDFELPGFKTIQAIKLNFYKEQGDDIQVSFGYKDQLEDAWAYTAWTDYDVRGRGKLYFPVTSQYFTIRIRDNADPNKLGISSIHLDIQTPDKSHTRGINVSSVDARG